MEPVRYAVIFEPDALDGGFNVRIPAFPHAHTQGDSIEESLANAREIIELELEVMAERGEAVPRSDADSGIRVERV